MYLKAVILALLTTSGLMAQISTAYRVTQSYPLGGNGGWD